MKTNGKYILDENGEPKLEPDLMKWAKWVEGGNTKRIVKQTRLKGYFVSTVFLSLDYQFHGGMPMLFETMVWYKDEDIYQDRHGSRQRAMLAHERIVNAIKYDKEIK